MVPAAAGVGPASARRQHNHQGGGQVMLGVAQVALVAMHQVAHLLYELVIYT